MKHCVDCEHHLSRYDFRMCKVLHKSEDPVTGHISNMDCSTARYSIYHCGPEAKLFTPKIIKKSWFFKLLGTK